MSSLRIRNSTTEDIAPMVATLREADRLELWRSSHNTPEQAITYGLRQSLPCYTAETDRLLCMFGVVPITGIEETGVAWMLCTTAVKENARIFLHASRQEFNLMLQRYEALFNFVDSENISAIKWLRWLGFTIYPARPYGIENCLFHRFEVKR